MDEATAQDLLRAERERIERALAAHGQPIGDVGDDDSDPNLEQHLADQATGLYDKEADAGLIGDLRDQLAAVERAERRLAEGTYGLSVESGKPIPDARLKAMPTAERTIEEQAAWERRR